MKRMFTAALTATALAASGGAQAWDSRTQFYSPGGAYLGEARTRNNPGIDASIPLQVRPMDPNGFSNSFARGLELRRLQNEIDREADRGYEAAEYTEDDAAADEILRRKRRDKAHAFARGEMADELRQVEEADRAVDRAREALWARNAELRRVQEAVAARRARENLRSPIDAMIVAGDQAGWEWCQNRPQPAMVDKREEAAREWCQIQAKIIQEESLVERDRMRDRQIELRRLIDGRSLTAGKTR